MTGRVLSDRLTHGLLAALVLALLLTPLTRSDATHTPANKPAAAGSKAEVFGPREEVTLLTTRLRASNPTDLILQVTAECSIVTNVVTIGNDNQRAFGEVKVWVEIDERPVPVATGDADGGRVVFCNRAYQRETSGFDEQATIKTFMSTRQANAFNWVALNVGNGIHTVAVKAALTEEITSNRAVAEAVVGNRTLVVEPAKLSNDAVIDAN